ncbi:DUF4365 domain-containing protein [Vallitalea guaymasensis]|uniref:DUF4365 domain-containing protein n=1 Tax=Vallitalea guaymasensis TaxID=1185412 RepID=UPI0023528A49|nr:DUF4365 domain-containing protein [Vallitalea guaymasensis]
MDNDIDGEIEVFEANDESKFETMASFVKVQLKATKNLKIDENEITYHLPIKFLHFADVCDNPIILFVYDVNSKFGYWIWIQDYIFNTLDISNPNWRTNKSKVTVKIPRCNSIKDLEKFRCDITNISVNGISEILQYRKNYLDNYCTELSIEDVSNPQQRKIAVKFLLEKTIASSKTVVKQLIRMLNERYKSCDYFRHAQLKKVHTDGIVDILLLYFYDDVRQKENGLPLCRTIWLKPNKDKGFLVGTPNEIVDDINLFWNDNSTLKDIYINKRMSKAEYMNLLEYTYIESYSIADEIKLYVNEYNSKKINEIELISITKSLAKKIDRLYWNYENRDLPPYECTEIDQIMTNCLCSLHNIKIFVESMDRDIKNKLWGIDFYLKSYFKDIQPYQYVKNKIR